MPRTPPVSPVAAARGGGSIDVVEVSPRDGLQNEKTLVSTETKVELILRAARAGARRIEAVSFVSPRAVPQMADAEAVLERLEAPLAESGTGARISALVLNRRGLDRALRARVPELNFVIVASETFNRRNQGVSIAETQGQLAEAAAIARVEGALFTVTIGASFGCPFEGEVDPGRVLDIAAAAHEAGISELAVADTIGVGDPLAVERLLAELARVAPGTPLRCHFHDTRNTGLANAYAAWRAGAAVLDASIGGVGGCPFAPAATGNIATEDLAYMLSRMGVETGLNLEGLMEAAAWLGEKLGKTPAGALSRAGAFPPPRAGGAGLEAVA